MEYTTKKGSEMTEMTATEKKFHENRRQIDRLTIRISKNQDTNAATRNALDRRLEADRRLLAKLAAEEEGE